MRSLRKGRFACLSPSCIGSTAQQAAAVPTQTPFAESRSVGVMMESTGSLADLLTRIRSPMVKT